MSSSTKHAVQISASRFSILNDDENDNDGGERSKEEKQNSSPNVAKNAKKKARKKKKAAAEHANTNEIRNLAFTKPVSAKAIQNIHKLQHPLTQQVPVAKPVVVSNDNVNPDWEQWKEKDKEFVVDQFQKDLQAALRLSEAEVQNVKTASTKTKKKKDAMSLHEFSSISLTNNPSVPSSNSMSLNGYCPEEVDPNYFECDPVLPDQASNISINISKKDKKKKKKAIHSNDAKDLAHVLSELHKEVKVENPSVTNSSIDTASYASWQNELHNKDEEIARLHNLVETLKEELTQVKRRNKQLCFILGQGEMKEKSEILMQVDQLTAVKNELSEQLKEMHVALEQERTKVSTLKSEVSKFQVSRTKSKSMSEEK